MAASRMSRLELLIGVWNTTGEVYETEAGPPARLSATDTYRWLPGRHFIVHEADARFGETPTRSMEVIGYDRERSKYTSRSYDDQGATEVFEVALRGRKWSIVGASVRFDGRFDADGRRLTGLWEMKGQRTGWQPWIRLALVRA